jgi:phosphodiesterase/alkaline phosphatase D-like protein
MKTNFLALALTLSAAGAVHSQNTPWPDPVANEVLPILATGVTHGPILGRPTSSSIRLWVRTLEESEVEVVYDTHLLLREDAPSVTGRSRASRDMIALVDVGNLEPDTRYFYGLRVNGVMADLRMDFHDEWPSFRTLPDATACADEVHNPKGLFNVCFAVGHCASQNPFVSGGQYVSTPAYDTLLREHANEAMFGIVNGDVIYEEERDGTLEGVRDNYKLYFSRGRSFNNLFRRLPAMFTFDDHDVGWDIHGCGQVGLGDGSHLIRDLGLKAYQEYLSWANPTGPQDGSIPRRSSPR